MIFEGCPESSTCLCCWTPSFSENSVSGSAYREVHRQSFGLYAVMAYNRGQFTPSLIGQPIMSALPRIRIVLADDHALVTEGLRNLIDRQPDMQVVHVVQNGDELVAFLQGHADIDVAVVDVQMPVSGLEALAEIRRRELPVRVLLLTAFADGESIQAALQYGAEGFALKTESPAQTIEAIRQVAQGRLVFPRTAQRWMSLYRTAANEEPVLSPREFEVLAKLARGLPNAEIAAELVVSENTIRFHLKNIYEKLGVTNRTEAVAWHFRQGQGGRSGR